MANLSVGQKAILTKRRTGEVKGNSYVVLAISGGRAKLQAGNIGGKDKWFDLRDLS